MPGAAQLHHQPAGPTFSGPQLAFAAVVSLVLYGVYVFVQTVRHRDYFLPIEDGPDSRMISTTTGTSIRRRPVRR